MKVLPVISDKNEYKHFSPAFKADTVFNEKSVTEPDILSLYNTKEIFQNTLYPNSKLLGIKIQRQNDKSVNLVSRYGHNVGQINYNPEAKLPKINLKMGAFQPMIEMTDEELGITVLMTRGSLLSAKDLNINYKSLSNNISFGHKLVVTTGYKPEKTQQIVNNYQSEGRYNDLMIDTNSLSELKKDYTIVGLGGGFGTRLLPISELSGDNKLSTKFPGTDKSLIEMSVLDKAYQMKDIDKVSFLNDDSKNLVGTAGIIIKGLKDGTIPMDKPLIVLTGDTFNNINLPKAVKSFENDNKCAMAMIVHKADNVFDKSCVKFRHSDYQDTFLIENFSPAVNDSNRERIKSEFGVYNPKTKNTDYYSSTNILMLKPEILKVLKKYANPDGSADLTEFLGLMYNVMNKSDENLYAKYPDGLSSEDLSIDELAYADGTPYHIFDKDYNILKLKAIIAEDIDGNDAVCEDVGTVENFIQTMQEVKNKGVSGLNQKFVSDVRKNITNDNVLLFGDDAKSRLDEFKSKYNINNLSGNVIVYSKPLENRPVVKNTGISELYAVTDTKTSAKPFIDEVVSSKKSAVDMAESLVHQYGLANFLNWYTDSKGYYGAYEEYTKDLYRNAKSIDELIKFMPNWAPWKLEQKSWLLKHPQYSDYSEQTQEKLFNNANDKQREEEFVIGKLPSEFMSDYAFKNMVTKLKAATPDYDYTGAHTQDMAYFKKLKGGDLNDKFIYLINTGKNKYILKFDRTNVEDAHTIDGRMISEYEKKSVRKNKYLSADSVYAGACISKYLELNGCKNIPRLYYYNNCANAALYEYVEDVKNDEFQKGLLGDDCEELLVANKLSSSLNDLGIYLNDTAYKNVLTGSDGVKKIIDLGHSNFMMPFKPGVKHYNIVFSNSNGPDVSNIYGGLFEALQTNVV